jgi:uncharacterized coiled-coil protein SlyX
MFFERLAVLLGGFAAGALLRRWQPPEVAPSSQRTVDRLSREWKAQARAQERRITRLEGRLEEQESRLNQAPSTAHLIAAMDDLLAKALHGLEGRLHAQSQSIETLQTTVAQTDELLERVLESLDSLRDTQGDAGS